MLELIDKINLDAQLKSRVIDLDHRSRVNIASLAEKCKNGDFKCLKYKNDLIRLAVIIQCAEYTLKKYKALGIQEDIFYDTLDDIRIWCENNNNRGLKNYNWLKNHINFELFKIGRLQFQFFRCNDIKLNYNKLPFKRGEKVINIHIPQGEKLNYNDCADSLKSAIEFFEKYFPEYDYNYFFCESWLLYDGNSNFMQPASNIMQFASLFDITQSYPYDGQAIERIFGKKQLNINKYPENTSLQKNAKNHLMNGGKLGIGVGIIYKNDLL